jgi:drug/metabolite transporter (DMT)-like permease
MTITPPPPPSERRDTALKASLALAASAACWGLATVATKGQLAAVPPMPMLVIQLTASVAFLWAAVLVTRAPVRIDRASLRASLSGLLEPGLAHTFGTAGLALTTASATTLISAAEAPATVLLAWLFLRERIGPRTLLVAAAAGAGVGLVILPDLDGLGGGSLPGDGLVGVATLLAAVYVIVSRRLIGGMGALQLVVLQQTVGLLWAGLALLAAAALGWVPLGLAGLAPRTIALAALTGVVQYAIAFWLWLVGLRHLPASRATLFLSLIPVFGVAGGALALGERLGPSQWIGAAVVLGAVQALVRAEPAAPQPVSNPPSSIPGETTT